MILRWSQPLPNHHRCSILERFFFLDFHSNRGLFENCQVWWQAAPYIQRFQSHILCYCTVQGMVSSNCPIASLLKLLSYNSGVCHWCTKVQFGLSLQGFMVQLKESKLLKIMYTITLTCKIDYLTECIL